jgi:serine protease
VANPIQNPGFETGSLSGWTATGPATTVTSAVSHSGTYAAQLGSTSPTTGDSAINQTFTAPDGSSQLTFWYQVVCPDTVTFDWATATLRDNTTGTTATVLSRTCTNTGAWVQVKASVTPGHSYTLTLVSHDDNFAGDPTRTFYDDVIVQ